MIFHSVFIRMFSAVAVLYIKPEAFSANIIQNSFTGYQFGPDVSNVMTSLIKTSVNVTSELDVETSELKTFRLTSREVIE